MPIQRLILYMLFLFSCSESVFAVQEYKVGVLSIRSLDKTINRWLPTIDYLSEQLPDKTFKFIPLALDKTESAVKNKQIDFLLVDSGQFVNLDTKYELRPLATLKDRYKNKISHQFGAIIFTLANRNDIKTLNDLKDKKFAAVSKIAFGGFQMAWRELLNHKIDPFVDFKKLEFIGFPQDDVVQAVLSGIVDAGTVRTGILEKMADKGTIKLSDFKILNLTPINKFPYKLSTQLYPEWLFAALEHVPESEQDQLKSILLKMPAEHEYSIKSKHAGWSDDFDYRSIQEMFKELKVGSYEQYFKPNSQFYWLCMR